MKNFTSPLTRVCATLFTLVTIVLLFPASTFAQVGVNTTTPGAGSIMDITSSDKGLLIPRVNITDLTTIAPVTGGSTESLLVYNTNTTTGPGFFYWDGSDWVSIGFDNDDWDLEGNSGTTPGTGAGQNFVGTTDNADVLIAANGSGVARMNTDGQIEAVNNGTAGDPSFTFSNDDDTGIYRSASNELSVATGGSQRLSVLSDGRIRSFQAGSAAAPLFSWDADNNTGVWRSADDRLNLGAGGREMIELRESGTTSEVVFNDGSTQTNFRVESNAEENLIFGDGTDDRVGFFTNNPLEGVHIAGASNELRIESLNSTNNAFNNGTDNSVVMVDSNGDLILQDRVDDFPVDANDATTFFASPVTIASATGSFGSAVVHTETFTLTRETLIEVCFWTACNVTNGSGGLTTDAQPRLYGGLVYLDDGFGGIAQDIIYSAASYTDGHVTPLGTTSTVTQGFFTIGGNGFITLPVGTHTISLIAFASGGANDTTPDGYRVTFGANAFNRFQIVYHN